MKQPDQDSVPRAISSVKSPAPLDRLSHWLIHYAAGNAPESLAERLEEEWLADRASRPSALSRLLFALGCRWAIRVITHEHCASGVAVASTPSGGKLMIDYLHDDLGLFSRRPMTLVLVVALHVVVFYGLMTSLNFNITKSISSPLQNQVVHEPQPQVLPPLPPPPTFTHSKVEATIPEFPQMRDVEETERMIPQPGSIQPPSTPTMPPHGVHRVLGGPGSGFPTTDDFYPSAAKRMEEQGVSTVRVCVDANGRLTSDPTTVQSAGSARLDQGALQLAKAGSGHYRASTEDGRPIDSCYSFRVRFQLRN